MNHLRPKYHYLPEKNWMNDPIGLSYVDGWYHMFYQYNPFGDTWGSMHWGHCRSRDLIRWEELPVALSPRTGAGEEHCFSGCVVVPEYDDPYLFYTRIPYGPRSVSHHPEQWLARGDRTLGNWPGKRRKQILSSECHRDMGELLDWRDPSVFRENGWWYMLLGGSLDGHGVILLYRSDDLENWEYRKILIKEGRDSSFLECPGIISTERGHVLLYSPANAQVRCLTGHFGLDESFAIEKEQILDNSGMEGLYAPQLSRDRDGHPYFIAWATEMSRQNSSIISGYNGAQTLPRSIEIEEDGYCSIKPHPACLSLRGESFCLKREAADGQWISLPDGGHQWEIEISLLPETKTENSPLQLRLCEDREAGEYTELTIDREKNRLTLDRSRSSNDYSVVKSELFIPLKGGEISRGTALTLRVFADGSLLEIYLNNRYCLTSRVYPLSPRSTAVSVSATGRDLILNRFICRLERGTK